ncbi:calcium-binding protein [Ensifer soli]|uniref:calcium-binding protein n=1 Tax=Ciceribacter sp. sgz301302 TaxID=3342379 RepID=UPI0035B94C11
MRFSFHNFIIDSIWNDTLEGTSDKDMIELSFGNDTAYGRAGDDVIWDKDGARNEGVWGGSDDRIDGGSGNDLIFGGWGADTIIGGSGYDTLDYRYSRSAVVVDLRQGKGLGDSDSASRGDTISGIEEIWATDFDDVLIARTNETIYAGGGNDILQGGTSNSMLDGGSGNNTFIVGAAANRIYAGSGFDTVDYSGLGYGVAFGYSAGSQAATAIGARLANTPTGADKIIATRFSDYIDLGVFSEDSYLIEAGRGNDTIITRGGNDTLRGGDGNDTLDGGAGNDTLYGDAGNDTLTATNGYNRLYGGTGNDTLTDGTDDDRLDGGAGNDILRSSFGYDTMTGGSGADTFLFDRYSQYCARPVIVDFNRADDIIDLSRIDAVTGLSGNQAFIFDPKGSGDIGTVRAEFVGNTTIVTTVAGKQGSYVDDMQIILNGRHTLTAEDFIL